MPLRYICDEHIAREVVRFLHYLYGVDGEEWIHVTDLGDLYEKAEDQWMLRVAEGENIIVTGDRDQSTRVTDRAIAEAGGRMLLLGSWFDVSESAPARSGS